MALRVVDELEVVEVDEQHAERNVAPARLHDHERKAVGEKRAVRQPGERIELREIGEPCFAVQAMQRRGHHARGRREEAGLLRAESAGRFRHRADDAARTAFRRDRHGDERAVAAQPFERQRQAFLPRPVQRHRVRRLEEGGELATGRVGRGRAEAGDAAQDHFALASAALQIRDHAAAQAFLHALHRLRDELRGIPLGKRSLAEARDFLLVARLRGAALLGAHALGEVA